MQPDLPTPADISRRLSLKDVTLGEAREKVIEFVTEHWEQSLITLAQKLIEKQDFPDEEAIELCLSFQPMFEENLRAHLRQFDENADAFIAACGEASNG